MKLSSNFIVHETDKEQIMVPIGGSTFSGIVRSNKTAAFIVRHLKDDTTEDEIVKRLLNTYDVPEAQAAIDVRKVLNNLRRIGAIEE